MMMMMVQACPLLSNSLTTPSHLQSLSPMLSSKGGRAKGSKSIVKASLLWEPNSASILLESIPHPDSWSALLPLMVIDPWSPNIKADSIASQLFAASLFPYLGFLYHLTKSKTSPNLTLFGFYFLLVFVGATIPAGIYAKVKYGTSLANVDWLHGGAESLLTLTNLFIVIGLRKALRGDDSVPKSFSAKDSETIEESSPLSK